MLVEFNTLVEEEDLCLTARIECEKLNDEGKFLSNPCLENIKSKFELTKDARNRAQVMMYKINCERNCDDIERSAKCVGFFVKDGRYRYSWEEE